MTDDTKEIQQLFPEGKHIKLKGKEMFVRPFGFGKFPKVLKILKDFKTGTDTLPANVTELPTAIKTMDVTALVADNSEKVIELCSLAINEKLAWFDDLPGDEGIELCQAIIEVNADFFVSRLQPKLLQALSGLSASVGALLSQDSSPTATASVT